MPTASATSGPGNTLAPAAGKSRYLFNMGKPSAKNLWEVEHIAANLADDQNSDAVMLIGIRNDPDLSIPLRTSEIRATVEKVGAAPGVYLNFPRPLRYFGQQFVIVEVRVTTVVNGGTPTVVMQADEYPRSERRHHRTV